MKLSTKDLRDEISFILKEILHFNGPYNDDHNVNVDSEQKIVDLSQINTVNSYKISRIIEALTNKDRQNVAAWKYVAEMLLTNRGFNTTNRSKSMPSIFGDAKKDGCLYSVKSSFQEKQNKTTEWQPVIGSARLSRSSLFNHSGFRRNIFEKHNCETAGMIFCFRKDLSQGAQTANMFGHGFSIRWYKTNPISIDELEEKSANVFGKKSVTSSYSDIINIFGNPELYWEIIFPETLSSNDDYNKKIELYDMIDSIPSNKYDILASYIKDLF